MPDLNNVNLTAPFLEILNNLGSNSLLFTIVSIGIICILGMLVMLKLLFISTKRADQRCLDDFEKLIQSQD